MRTAAKDREPVAAVIADESFHEVLISGESNGELLRLLGQLKSSLNGLNSPISMPRRAYKRRSTSTPRSSSHRVRVFYHEPARLSRSIGEVVWIIRASVSRSTSKAQTE